MSKPIPYLLQGKNIIVVIDGKSHTISRDTHIAYTKIVDALKAQDWDELRDLVEPKKIIVKFGKGNITIDGSTILWKGQPFHNALSSRMIEMFQDGFPVEPMVNFMENLMQNPSKRSVDQLYGFLEKNSLPITEDGYFLAYKKVRRDYKDIHSGTFDNSVGQVISMDRNLVDDDPDSYCSTGLHFCSLSYLGAFGGANDPIMILKINPADVVSIPNDYDGAKGRCMKYEVIAEVDGDPKDAFAGVVDKKYAPAKPVSNPQAAWPFATTNIDTDTYTVDIEDDFDYSDDLDEDSYDVVRAYARHWTIAEGVSLDEARELVAKAERQKKAKLVIIDQYGNDVE